MLRINLEGREPEGAVKRADYESVRQELSNKLRRLIDPTTNRPVNGRVFVREEIYQGKYAEQMPDLVYVALEEGYIVEQPMALPFVSNRLIIEDPKMSGNHRLDGIFIAHGPYFKHGATINGANLLDLAPTILHLVGCPIPTDMDGRVLTELFPDDFVKRNPIVYAAATHEVDQEDLDLSPEDQAAVLERLRGLGYID
jgi:predicted AlkP superfamily phosphohydrolase/phosphomutase